MDNPDKSYFQAFKQIAKTANSSLSLKKALNSIAKSTAKALRAAGCTIMLLNPQREYLDIVAAHGLSDMYLRKGALNARKSLPDIVEGKVAAIFDISQDKRAQYPEAAEMEKISSVLGAPLLQKGEVVGEIRIYTEEPRHFSQTHKDFLSAVANIIAATLQKAELHQALQAGHSKTVTKRREPRETPEAPASSLRPSSFGHPSEEEFARLLDFYRIEWLYEPRSFPLAWDGDKVAEMFTPDFYLPELDLYIELTTLKQSLITEKNRKLRRLREVHPEVNIKLLNKKDYLRLLAKYGYGALGETKVEGIDRVLFSHTQIERQTKALATRISRDYVGRQLVLVGILKGVICFMADLMQHISLPLTVDFMAISYYGGDADPAVKITKDLDTSIAGLDVLMVEDIVDTGMTLNYVLNHLSSHKPATLHVCTLLDKRARRLADVPLDYIGFEVPDEFVVGYGLDYHGEYRNLPFIGALNPGLIEEGWEKQTSPK
ncbi:MAG: hypoxanthine phosphoribosyltransferase [Dehalococcoidia bacterium]|nr:hypoxanthine phosphoribosyltransferase [Dehalococcoidia bacterium]